MKKTLLATVVFLLLFMVYYFFMRSTSVYNADKYSSVCGAIRSGDLEAVRVYISRDDIENTEQEPLLFQAIMNREILIVEYLLDEYVKDVNEQIPRTGDTALHYAVMVGEIKIVELLLKSGADVSIKNYEDETPIDFSKEHVYSGSEKIQELLEENLK